MKIRKQILRDICWYFVEKVDKKPEFFNDITNTLNNVVFNSRSDTINKYSFYKQFNRCVIIIFDAPMMLAF